jgi:hypothetical protein
MQHLIISALAGLAGYSFVMLAGFKLKGKPLNCQVCMAFWFGLITSLLVEPSFYAPAVGFGSMWFAAMAQKTLLK